MRMTLKITSNFKTKAVQDKVKKAAGEALRDVVVKMVDQIKTPWPVGTPYLTGNNARSILFEVDVAAVTAAIYSTSGYGGYLEVGTVKKAPRPYMKPALDKYFPQIADIMRGKL